MPHGQVLSGEAGFRLHNDPDTTVGIDVAYISAEMAAGTAEDAFLVEGPPILAVEIISPSDRQGAIGEKIEAYLAAGVSVVWIVETRFKTVTVHESGREPVMFNNMQELVGDPHLPGFRVSVAKLFS